MTATTSARSMAGRLLGSTGLASAFGLALILLAAVVAIATVESRQAAAWQVETA